MIHHYKHTKIYPNKCPHFRPIIRRQTISKLVSPSTSLFFQHSIWSAERHYPFQNGSIILVWGDQRAVCVGRLSVTTIWPIRFSAIPFEEILHPHPPMIAVLVVCKSSTAWTQSIRIHWGCSCSNANLANYAICHKREKSIRPIIFTVAGDSLSQIAAA